MKHSLEVYFEGKLIFHSDKNWLYPLFDLEKFLINSNQPPSQLLLCDKIIGRAAALILVYLGIRNVKGGIVSEPAIEILEKYEVDFEYESLVKRIQCRTEELLIDEFDPKRGYDLVQNRIEEQTESKKGVKK